jgi:hypothetical protein
MATLTVSTDLFSRAFTLPDGDLDRILASYQAEADIALAATATTEQVFYYICEQWLNRLSDRAVSYDNSILTAAIVPAAAIEATYLDATGTAVSVNPVVPKLK